MKPRVSIIITCYNLKDYISEAIMSVKAQQLTEFECIIVDDASTDGSAMVIAEAAAGDDRFCLIKLRSNSGPAHARNVGIAEAEADLIIVLDGDDMLTAKAAKLMVEAMENDQLAALAAGAERRFGLENRQIMRSYKGYDSLLQCNSLNVCGCFRWADWERIGGYRSGTMYEDWDFWIRLLYHNDRVIHVGDVTVNYRVRKSSRLSQSLPNHDAHVEEIRRWNSEIYAGREILYERAADAPVLVVIPYLDRESQGRELELAIRGWFAHFREKFLLVVVGDRAPVLDEFPDVIFINCPQVPPSDGNYRPHLDHVNKFLAVRRRFPRSRGFIYTCDDIYAVNDFTLADVQVLKAHSPEYKGIPNGPNFWQQDLAKTRRYADEHRLETVNYVCHLPVWYDWDKLLRVYRECDAKHNSMVYEMIYFNKYFAGVPPIFLNDESDRWRCRVDDNADERNTIRMKIRRKIWMYNTVDGYNSDLEAVLDDHYKKIEVESE